MMKQRFFKSLILLTGILCLLVLRAMADETEEVAVIEPKVAKYNYEAMPKDPIASAFFSATIPGTGQLYNKEYGRGVIVAAGFYAGLLTTQYMLRRWEALNSDTFYVAGYDVVGRATGYYYQVIAPKPEDSLVGLPTEEKVILGVSALVMAGSYALGIIDAYRGANRYNQKLFARMPKKLKLACSPGPRELGLRARYRF